MRFRVRFCYPGKTEIINITNSTFTSVLFKVLFHHMNSFVAQIISNKSCCIYFTSEKKVLESPPWVFGPQVPLSSSPLEEQEVFL